MVTRCRALGPCLISGSGVNLLKSPTLFIPWSSIDPLGPPSIPSSSIDPLSLVPWVPWSLFPLVPLSLGPSFPSVPFVPLSLGPLVPWFLCPSVPWSLGPCLYAPWRSSTMAAPRGIRFTAEAFPRFSRKMVAHRLNPRPEPSGLPTCGARNGSKARSGCSNHGPE